MAEYKSVMIDDVDVSGCFFYKENGECINENVYPDYCKACSNCTYKLEQQLKRKEQECERLKDELSTYGATGICETCTAKSVLQNDKYTRALREIKEIADLSIAHFDIDYLKQAINEILQKCEVLNGR